MSEATQGSNDSEARTDCAQAPFRDMRPALRASLALDLLIRLTVWTSAFALSVWIFTALGFWPKGSPLQANGLFAVKWAFALGWWILLFNVAYVAVLLVLRLICPIPREGRYPKAAGAFNRQLVWASLTAALNKARCQASFPGFLVFHVANLPPMCWLMGPVFGPKSGSCYAMEPNILDPHMVKIGRNVVIGFNATVAGHYQERDAWYIKRTVIEDNVVIGGHAVIYGGVCIHVGAVVAAGAIVLPNTVIGASEFWGGVPARKLRDLPA